MTRIVVFLVLLLSTIASAQPYTVVSTTTTVPTSGLTRVETVVQDGASSNDRFTMTRVYGAGPFHGAVILQPGSGTNFELYEMNEVGDYTQSTVGYLALRGYDVYGYSPRTKGIPSGTCTVGNCAFMNNWGLDTVADDTEYIRQQAGLVHGTKLPVLMGWSLGAITTLATLDKYPNNYSGAVIWEGLLYSTNPLVVVGNAANCAFFQAQITAGVYVGNGSLSALVSVASLPALVRDPLLYTAATLHQPSPPGFVPGYQLLAGSPLGFTYASMARLVTTLLTSFNPYESNAINRDFTCTLAGNRSFNSNLGAYTKPTLVLETGTGFGPFMADTLNLLGTPAAQMTIQVQAGFGHGDHFAGTNHIAVLEQPVYNWLLTVLP